MRSLNTAKETQLLHRSSDAVLNFLPAMVMWIKDLSSQMSGVRLTDPLASWMLDGCSLLLGSLSILA